MVILSKREQVHILKEFTQKEVAEVLGIKAQTIAFYANKGLIIPEFANPKGRGKTRVYSKKNLAELLILKELSAEGVSLEKIKAIIEQLQHIGKRNDQKTSFRQLVNNARSYGNYPIFDTHRIFLMVLTPSKNSDVYKPDVEFQYLKRTGESLDLFNLLTIPISDVHDEYFSSVLILDITGILKKVSKI